MVPASTHLKLAFAWITYTNTLSVDKMRPLMADNFIRQLRPASLGAEPIAGEPYLTLLAGAPIENFNVGLPVASIIHIVLKFLIQVSLPRPEDIVEDNNAIQFYVGILAVFHK